MSDSGSVFSHSKSTLVTREQLAALTPVLSTRTFKPVPHIELVVSLERILADRDIQIRTYDSGALAGLKREQFAISKDGSRLFGTLDLTMNGIGGTCASLGLRTANNRTMALQMIAGLRVFVCDNMAFSGDTIMMKRKHTSGLNLMPELFRAVDRYEQHFRDLKTEIGNLQNYALTETAAKVLIHDIFAGQIMPVRFLPAVSNEYFAEEQRHAEFSDRTAWSLLNAFTEVAKGMPLTTRIDATQEVGAIFGRLVR